MNTIEWHEQQHFGSIIQKNYINNKSSYLDPTHKV